MRDIVSVAVLFVVLVSLVAFVGCSKETNQGNTASLNADDTVDNSITGDARRGFSKFRMGKKMVVGAADPVCFDDCLTACGAAGMDTNTCADDCKDKCNK